MIIFLQAVAVRKTSIFQHPIKCFGQKVLSKSFSIHFLFRNIDHWQGCEDFYQHLNMQFEFPNFNGLYLGQASNSKAQNWFLLYFKGGVISESIFNLGSILKEPNKITVPKLLILGWKVPGPCFLFGYFIRIGPNWNYFLS